MDLRFVLLTHIIGICWGLRDVYIQIPSAVEKGESAVLQCWYKLDDPLYTVKWYKNGKEFYRYTPADSPPTKAFPTGTLQVDLAASKATQVALTHLDFDASGVYTCEVSEDMPSFHTVVVHGRMNVVELPWDVPAVSGLRRKYKVGDTMMVNCTSGRSRPAANLTWYVDDRQPLESQVRTYRPLGANDSRWQISQIGLQLVVTPGYFAAGRLRIRCSAWIYDLYWQSTEVSVEEDTSTVAQPEPVTTAMTFDDDHLQPPPTPQTDQHGPDGHLNVEGVGPSSASMRALGSLLFTLGLLMTLRLAVN